MIKKLSANSLVYIGLIISIVSCTEKAAIIKEKAIHQPVNLLNYMGSPASAKDKQSLMFSDQGAWFAFGFPSVERYYGGFSGPFLMTQENGVWSSPVLSQLIIENSVNEEVTWNNISTASYNSHLEQTFTANNINLHQILVYSSGNTAIIRSVISNSSEQAIQLSLHWKSQRIYANGLVLTANENEVSIESSETNAVGHIIFPQKTIISNTDSSYVTSAETISLAPNETKELLVAQSFVFPEYSWEKEKEQILAVDFDRLLAKREEEKKQELVLLKNTRRSNFNEPKYGEVLSKSVLTLQNNWRIAAGEIKNEGLFPSYHYKWFNGFWSWDSWKHAVGLSYYNTALAKNQMRAMFDFQLEDGFIVDCVFRDTTIEAHNYRDTKPPLAAWAVAKIYQQEKDISFIEEFYPKLKKYHAWWYKKRDHDNDGLCEYGSTDGSLIAAKWESGMDNAIRFDDSKILKNADGAYSLDQESVDLNAYLYAEKLYLASLADALNNELDAETFRGEAEILITQIQRQFYDENDGWFYDTDLAGTTFIKGEGSEGWIPLWAKVASPAQAEAVKSIMLDSTKFYTKVPFQTMSADHAKFNPLNGYWRGPNWLDQAYFGIKGLRNYGYNEEADKATVKLLEGAEGLLDKGFSIRENYHPLTGEGLNAQNFSWSAAHIIMLLMEEQ
jgi:putative isomerase